MKGKYDIRKARPGDLDRIMEIESASFGCEAYDRKLFADFLRACGDLFLVAGRRGVICGYLVSCLRGDPVGGAAELVSIAVDPLARGCGAASALLESALRRLRHRRVDRMHLVVRVTNQPALRFYEKYGFRKVRTVRAYYEDAGDGIVMSRKITMNAAMLH